jgi:hypothetical protein
MIMRNGKVLLQDLTTCKYVEGEDKWTGDPRKALGFMEVVCALDYALSHSLEDVRPVLKFDHSRNDFALPPLCH